MTTMNEPIIADSPKTSNGGRTEVIYLTYGEPAAANFGAQYRYSLAILKRLTLRVAPIPRFVLPLIAAYRAWTRCRMFRHLGFSSPLEEISERQRDALEASLRARHPDREISVRLVYEFREPFLPERLKAIPDPPEELIILPSYIAESDFTSGVSRADLASFHEKSKGTHGWPEPKYINSLGRDSRLADIMANHVLGHCRREGWTTEESVLVLGAHGTVINPPPGILNGLEDTATLAAAIKKRLKPHFRQIGAGFLNHTLGGDWTEPPMDKLAEKIRSADCSVVYFPYGFTTDNAESLVEGPEALEPQASLLCVPSLNDSPALTEFFTDRVEEAWRASPEPWEAMKKTPIEEPEPEQGKPGWFRAKAPALALVAALLWISGGIKLLLRGVPAFIQLTEMSEQGLAIALALLVTYFKGYLMLGALAKRNLVRLRRLPQPSPLYRVFPLRTYILILFFAIVGMGIKLLLASAFAKAWILLGVGGALFMGGFVYLLNYRMSRPQHPKVEAPP